MDGMAVTSHLGNRDRAGEVSWTHGLPDRHGPIESWASRVRADEHVHLAMMPGRSVVSGSGGGASPPERSAADRWPWLNAGEVTQAWKDSSSRQRVTTSQTVRSSVGWSSSKPSNPSWLSTAPARAANRWASSSPLSAGTVIALILMTVMASMFPPGTSWPAGYWSRPAYIAA